MKKKKKSIRIWILLLAVVWAACSGCKSSPVLSETVYDNDTNEVDTQTDLSAIENSENNTAQDEELPPQEQDETADTPRGRERETPLPDEEREEQAADAPDILYDSNVQSNLETGVNSAGDRSNQDGLQSNTDIQPDSDQDNQKDAITSTENSSNQEGNDSEDSSGGDSTKDPNLSEAEENTPIQDSQAVRHIVDAYGKTVEIPTQVQSVSAVGEAAILVCMLDGSEKLTASSESLNDGLSGQILNAPDCTTLWSDSGQAALSNADFDTLLNLHPQVCFEISGQNTFSEEQIMALNEAEIAYVVLPALTSGTNIRQAVQLIGEVLGSESVEKAQEYLDFYQDVLYFVSSRVDTFSPDGINYDTGEKDSSLANRDGVYTLFIEAWDSSVQYTLHDDAYVCLSGTGLPVAQTGYTASPINYFLSLAGVANSGALSENCYSAAVSKLKYVNPIISPNKALSLTGGTAASYDTRYVLTNAGGYYLGDEKFSSVLVADQTIKENIELSPLWDNYGQINSATGLTNGYGFLDQNGDIVTTTIHNEYDIFVLPTGVGSWADGSAESVLTSVWAAWRLRGEVTLAEVQSYVSDFYARFYDYTLSETQIKQILLTGT